MIKKLSKYGNSHALIIDKPILELFNIGPTTELEITVEGNSLVITPLSKRSVVTEKISDDAKLQKIYEKIKTKHKKALKKLAKV